MNKTTLTPWRLLPFILFLGVVFFLWRGLSLDPHVLPSIHINKQLPAFHLPLLTKPNQELTQNQLRGKLSLINIWASWCNACVDEQFFLMQLKQKGISIYGINYKDNSAKALRWLARWGNPYIAIAADKNGRVALDLGVYGTPETFLIDAQGRVLYRQVGAMNEQIWKQEFIPKIAKAGVDISRYSL